MRSIGLLLLLVFLCASGSAQMMPQPIYDAQRAFERAVAEKGAKPAFLEFLSDDAVLFRPEAVNGREYLEKRNETAAGTLSRRVNFADISVNGLLGYTIGEWTLIPKGKPGAVPKVGQYATVWSKRLDGKYKAILDIEISHDPEFQSFRRGALPPRNEGDKNKWGWSAVDTAMNFLRMSMTKKGLGGAYDKFASDDIVLLREGMPPITGSDAASKEMEKYIAVDFPAKVSQFETGDIAYSWNPCAYATSNEGMEKGNCLHIWKFRDKKWRIVLGVFARISDPTIPVLKESSRRRRPSE